MHRTGRTGQVICRSPTSAREMTTIRRWHPSGDLFGHRRAEAHGEVGERMCWRWWWLLCRSGSFARRIFFFDGHLHSRIGRCTASHYTTLPRIGLSNKNAAFKGRDCAQKGLRRGDESVDRENAEGIEGRPSRACARREGHVYAQMGSTISGPLPTACTLNPTLRSTFASTMPLPSKTKAGFFMLR